MPDVIICIRSKKFQFYPNWTKVWQTINRKSLFYSSWHFSQSQPMFCFIPFFQSVNKVIFYFLGMMNQMGNTGVHRQGPSPGTSYPNGTPSYNPGLQTGAPYSNNNTHQGMMQSPPPPPYQGHNPAAQGAQTGMGYQQGTGYNRTSPASYTGLHPAVTPPAAGGNIATTASAMTNRNTAGKRINSLECKPLPTIHTLIFRLL